MAAFWQIRSAAPLAASAMRLVGNACWIRSANTTAATLPGLFGFNTMREHALLNDNAVMRKPITQEDHRSSRPITDPFRLLGCGLESDGGAAVVVSSAEIAADLRHHGSSSPASPKGTRPRRPSSPSKRT
jgi:hypothetical protein